MATAYDKPFELRWGIIGTGLIASWFVSDLTRDPAKDRGVTDVKHKVQAIGSSSLGKATTFSEKFIPPSVIARPTVYDSYEQVYNDPEVDIVYVATPHALHLRNALDAIQAGKHVLCEKPMTINARDSEILIKAAREKGVFLMEAVWTRFFPVVKEIQRLIHLEKAIGKLTRVMIDFGLDMPLDKQNPGSRVSDLSLGAGNLLDVGIYTLTWASMLLFAAPENNGDAPVVVSSLVFNKDVDEISTVVLSHPKMGAQAICTASYLSKSDPVFGRIEGTDGVITIHGRATSKPLGFVLKKKGGEEQTFEFNFDGWGFFYEADAVARDIKEGRLENDTMPLGETLRVMRLMDQVRAQNGLKYPQDSE